MLLKLSKILTILFVSIGATAFGQCVQIDTLRLDKVMNLKTNRNGNLFFPVICSGNKEIDRLINSDLRNRFTDFEYPNERLDSTLIKWAGDQIEYIDFEVSYNQNGILSLNISAEICGAYCTSRTDYFNYSIVNGKWLTISDIIDTTSVFKIQILKNVHVQYERQKRALREMLHNPGTGIDESTYLWALEHYEDCESNFNLNTFAIYPDQLNIINDCHLPNAIKYLTPDIELKYHFSDIRNHLKIMFSEK